MAGILDKKTRVMDVIVTREGRRQMADGDLRATFASFTDKHTFYEKDIVSGSTDPTKRIYFEACSLAILFLFQLETTLLMPAAPTPKTTASTTEVNP